jgi:hypothetical protein
LSDNGGSFRAKDTHSLAKELGIKPVHTPVCSPQSNGMAESFVNTFKRDYVSQMDRSSADIVLRQLPAAFKHFNEIHPHSSWGYKSPSKHVSIHFLSAAYARDTLALAPFTKLIVGDLMKWKSFVAMVLIASAASAQVSDIEAARLPVENYIQAHATGDPAIMRKAFHPDAKIYSYRDGKLQTLTVDEFAKLFPGKPAANEAQRVRRIEHVDVTGNAGSAKVFLDYPTVTFTDYMALLKVDGEWKIINKTFNGVPKPKQ